METSATSHHLRSTVVTHIDPNPNLCHGESSSQGDPKTIDLVGTRDSTRISSSTRRLLVYERRIDQGVLSSYH